METTSNQSEPKSMNTALKLLKTNDIHDCSLYICKNVEDYEHDFEENVELAAACIEAKKPDNKTVYVRNENIMIKLGIGKKNAFFDHGIHGRNRYLPFGNNWELANEVLQAVKEGIHSGEYRTALSAYAKEQKRLSNVRQTGIQKRAA